MSNAQPNTHEAKVSTTQGYGHASGEEGVNPAVVHTRNDQKRQTEGVREAQLAKNPDSATKLAVDKAAAAIVPPLGQADAYTTPEGKERRSPVSIAPTQAGQSSAIPKLEKAEVKAAANAKANDDEAPPAGFMPGFTEPVKPTDEHHAKKK